MRKEKNDKAKNFGSLASKWNGKIGVIFPLRSETGKFEPKNFATFLLISERGKQEAKTELTEAKQSEKMSFLVTFIWTENLEAKRSEFFSFASRSERMRKRSSFASFCFEAKPKGMAKNEKRGGGGRRRLWGRREGGKRRDHRWRKSDATVNTARKAAVIWVKLLSSNREEEK